MKLNKKHRTKHLQYMLFALLAMIACSCNYTKHLTDNQTLVKKNSITVRSQKPIKYKGEFESTILSLISPQANSHVFDLDFLPKYKLWKYNNRYAYYEKHDSDKKLLKHKVEKPTLLDTAMIFRTEKVIQQYLINQGYFYAKVSSQLKPLGNKMVEVHYDIETGKSYFINKIFHEYDQPIFRMVMSDSKESFLNTGSIFSNYSCGLERDRIYRVMQQQGFYDFKSDNVSFLVDTSNKQALSRLLDDPFEVGSSFNKDSTSRNDSLNVKVIINETRDSSYAIPYYIDSVLVYINDNYTAVNDQTPVTMNQLDSIFFVYKSLPVNRKIIARNIFILPHELYNPKNKELTVNRLNQLNVFQFVNVRFDKVASKPGKLVCKIILTTQPRREYAVNMDANTTDADYYFGFGTSLQYKDRNLFHGANQFFIKSSVSAQFRNDTLLTGVKQFYLSGDNVNVNASLTFPKFIVPFIQNKFSKKNLPFTLVGFNYNYIQRRSNYTIKNISGSFGYTWKETDYKNWRFNPAFLTLTFVPERNLSAAFQERKKQSQYLNSIFSSNIIYGENVNFEYRSKEKKLYKSLNTLKLGFEEAGTILKGINTIYRSIANDSILNISHYLRADVDYRSYKNRRKAQWVNRLLLGFGMPLSQANSLPYIKQYSAGGSFSLRGFQARTVGPGHSNDSSYSGNKLLIDRTGDLKLEGNTEYRFNLLKLFSGAINLKGAGFVDVGNIWLYKKDESISGGEFNPKYFFRDLAMSAGAGVRLDFSFFVLRVDLAYPVKQPSVKENYGFMFDKLNYYKDVNVVLGFGYPF